MIFEDELDLHILSKTNTLEVDYIIDKFLDQAISEGKSPVLIITGIGSGKIRRFVREKIGKDRRVKKWQSPLIGQGDEGAIAVWLRDC